MELLYPAALCVACLLPVVLLRKKTPEQSLLLTVAILAAVLLRCLRALAPLMGRLEDLFAQAGLEASYISILIKTVGVALVTRLCGDLCRDGGSQALASAVETAGAAAAAVIAFPLLEAVVGMLLEYL